MRQGKRLSAVQVPAGVPGQLLRTCPETNLRLVAPGSVRTVTCRRVEVVAGVWSNQLRFALCGILRGRDGVVAIPSNLRDKELFLLGNEPSALQPIQRDDYQAEFRDAGGIDLDLKQETGRKAIAQLLEL